MQNAQNADIQRVINLVELYRTKVGKESDIATEACRIICFHFLTGLVRYKQSRL